MANHPQDRGHWQGGNEGNDYRRQQRPERNYSSDRNDNRRADSPFYRPAGNESDDRGYRQHHWDDRDRYGQAGRQPASRHRDDAARGFDARHHNNNAHNREAYASGSDNSGYRDQGHYRQDEQGHRASSGGNRPDAFRDESYGNRREPSRQARNYGRDTAFGQRDEMGYGDDYSGHEHQWHPQDRFDNGRHRDEYGSMNLDDRQDASRRGDRLRYEDYPVNDRYGGRAGSYLPGEEFDSYRSGWRRRDEDFR